MPLRRLDATVGRLYLGLLDVWRDTKFREIYGIGMIALAFGLVASPRGSVLTLVGHIPGMTPILFAIYTMISGYLLGKYGHRGSIQRFIYSLPLMLYIIATIELTVSRWPDAALAPSIIYSICYLGLLRAIAIEES